MKKYLMILPAMLLFSLIGHAQNKTSVNTPLPFNEDFKASYCGQESLAYENLNNECTFKVIQKKNSDVQKEVKGFTIVIIEKNNRNSLLNVTGNKMNDFALEMLNKVPKGTEILITNFLIDVNGKNEPVAGTSCIKG